ncbi:UNVERIFIED_CONTAM: hypothetical protein GTU68_066246 [Idotea baltica]|nr:hypothetical protein [Idotea baltica]
MLAEISKNYPLIQETFAEASDVLGYDLWDLIQSGPIVQLNQTDKTQPAILAASVALWRLWCTETSDAIKPNFVAGHSLGEYTALVASDSLSLSDGVKLVERRGQLMQEAVPVGQGGMAAILGLDDELVVEICNQITQEQNGLVQAVNFNAPGQVVIAGNVDTVTRAVSLCKERGAKRALVLPVSVPSHCDLMHPAAEKFAENIEKIKWNPLSIPLVQNVSAEITTDLTMIKTNLLTQLYQPVRWTESIHCLVKEGVHNIVECGPGKVLSGLNKRSAKDTKSYFLETPEAFLSTLEQLAEQKDY